MSHFWAACEAVESLAIRRSRQAKAKCSQCMLRPRNHISRHETRPCLDVLSQSRLVRQYHTQDSLLNRTRNDERGLEASYLAQGEENGAHPPSRAEKERKFYSPPVWDKQVEAMISTGRIDRFMDQAPSMSKLDINVNAKMILAEFERALRFRDPNRSIRALLMLLVNSDRADILRALQTIPRTSISEIIRILDPEILVGKHRRLDLESSPHFSKRLEKRVTGGSDGLHYSRGVANLARVVLEANSAGKIILGLGDYKCLLRFTRAVGDLSLAKSLWLAMELQSIRPDLECYNHYLSVCCFVDLAMEEERYFLRVNTSNLQRRDTQEPTSIRGHRTGRGGVRGHALALFDDMFASGIAGDEETFCIMMTAMAREGDLRGAESVLQRVWGLNVEKIQNDDSATAADLRAVRQYPRDSPFRPTERLLFTLAHIYGINEQIPTAVRLVDHVARAYSVSPSRPVWMQLLDHTRAASARRSRAADADAPGPLRPRPTLDRGAVQRLWETMTGEPYNVRPTLAMLDKLVRALVEAREFAQAERCIDEGIRLYRHSSRQHGRALLRSLVVSAVPQRRGDSGGSSSRQPGRAANTATAAAAAAAAEEEEAQRYRTWRDRRYIRQWCMLFCARGSGRRRHQPQRRDYAGGGSGGRRLDGGHDDDDYDWPADDSSAFFSAQTIPCAVERWRAFLPQRVRYRTPTGAVSLVAANTSMQRRVNAQVARWRLARRVALGQRGGAATAEATAARRPSLSARTEENWRWLARHDAEVQDQRMLWQQGGRRRH